MDTDSRTLIFCAIQRWVAHEAITHKVLLRTDISVGLGLAKHGPQADALISETVWIWKHMLTSWSLLPHSKDQAHHSCIIALLNSLTFAKLVPLSLSPSLSSFMNKLFRRLCVIVSRICQHGSIGEHLCRVPTRARLTQPIKGLLHRLGGTGSQSLGRADVLAEKLLKITVHGWWLIEECWLFLSLNKIFFS